MYATEEMLINMSEREAMKLSRPERRRRDRLIQKMQKHSKIGIGAVDNNSSSDMITISKAELQRLVDANVKAKIESVKSWREKAFRKMTYEMFYIISYVMYKYYGFGPKRMTQFCSYMFETYFDCYMDLDNGLETPRFEQIRSELNEKFRIDLFRNEFDEDGTMHQYPIDEQAYHDSVRGGTWA